MAGDPALQTVAAKIRTLLQEAQLNASVEQALHELACQCEEAQLNGSVEADAEAQEP
jgi:hypothetical protein